MNNENDIKAGYLGIPLIDIVRLSPPRNNIFTRSWLLYHEILKSEIGEGTLRELQKDARVTALEGKNINNGSGSSRFNIDELAMWYIWSLNEHGDEKTKENFNEFLDKDTLTVINAEWVLGFHTSSSVELDNGVRIIPIEDMPISLQKEAYLKLEISHSFRNIYKPQTAIIKECEINKLEEEFNNDSEFKQLYRDSFREIRQVSLILNLLDGISSAPYVHSTYSHPEKPFGIFNGGGSGHSVSDAFGKDYEDYAPYEVNVCQVNELISSFDSLDTKKKTRLTLAISRLSQAKRRVNLFDKILDLGIAIEMALLDNNKNAHQLSLSCRLRGSWLVGKNASEREEISFQLRDIYNFRSQVAHSGTVSQNEISKLQENIESYFSLACKIFKELIIRKDVDLNKIILG